MLKCIFSTLAIRLHVIHSSRVKTSDPSKILMNDGTVELNKI